MEVNGFNGSLNIWCQGLVLATITLLEIGRGIFYMYINVKVK